MKIRILLAAAVAALLSGCTTTEEANTAIQSRWIGQPADAFFTRYGPPQSRFPLNDGGSIYSWRGGDKTNYIPAQYAQPSTDDDDVFGKSVTKTTTREDGNETTVTTTRTSFGISDNTPRMIAPARTEQLFCEVQISTGPDDRITTIRASNDTTGEGLSLSRCAEVLEVQK
ncbi:hypothetical protein [Pararhizobium arenae]|uniref:hypothetical protein n=1 Tax=Pararhizobium arenae TaxID=1856850 RepID=UPI00094ADC86|nr:hypothetical protein [Pararhizobium arenae]